MRDAVEEPGRSQPPKANPFCLQCHREVPLTAVIATMVTKDRKLVGHLHRFHCQGEWQASHPAGYEYGSPIEGWGE